MKKRSTMQSFRFMTGFLLISLLTAGCQKAESSDQSVLEPISEKEENIQEETAEFETIRNNQEGHYVFEPHVFGSRYLEQFGEDMRDTFFAYCDAVRNGEESFPCPDQESLNWCVGRFSHFFMPLAQLYVQGAGCEDGTAYITYAVPAEAFVQKEKEFEETITGILNDCLSDDYIEPEKILALYEYMTKTYAYDYEMYDQKAERMDEQGTCRCLTEKKGICNEIASLYNYLLLQAGIDSEVIDGVIHHSEDWQENHTWVFVTLEGKSYHVDPTFAVTAGGMPLDYFMMSDEIRERRDDIPKETYCLAAKGDESGDFFSFEAPSDVFKPLWNGIYIGMDRKNKEIVYEDLEGVIRRFSYD